MKKRMIVLQSDFGVRDGAAAVMEGVIERINPQVKVKHLTHQVTLFDIGEASFLLLTNYWHYPLGTIFVSVVDPGVGTERKIIFVEGNNYCFIGPDNGLLYPIIKAEPIKKIFALDKAYIRELAYNLTKDMYFKRPISSVFEGRDVFCPAAALFALGYNNLGEEIQGTQLKKINFALKKSSDTNIWEGEVIYIDDYGNLLISCTKKEFDLLFGNRQYRISVKNRQIFKISRTYTEGKEKELIAIFGGDFEHPTRGSFLEVAVNEGNAAEVLGLKKGDTITIERK